MENQVVLYPHHMQYHITTVFTALSKPRFPCSCTYTAVFLSYPQHTHIHTHTLAHNHCCCFHYYWQAVNLQAIIKPFNVQDHSNTVTIFCAQTASHSSWNTQKICFLLKSCAMFWNVNKSLLSGGFNVMSQKICLSYQNRYENVISRKLPVSRYKPQILTALLSVVSVIPIRELCVCASTEGDNVCGDQVRQERWKGVGS
jgi:hypothetical protein